MDSIMVVLWSVVLVVAIIAEISTVQMISIWFAVASLASLILACLNAPLWAQVAVFAAVVALLLILTKPFVRRIQGKHSKTNADINIGKTAVVTEDINNSRAKGRATVAGVSWMARSIDGSEIAKDSIVIIEDIDGAKLIVSLKN
ncbi:MAG: NfeD family protein [Oscillospiraceae bacterium]|nr:NfeD family protein [Oscillospiraceae bacterium]